jgi:hypothetical protein
MSHFEINIWLCVYEKWYILTDKYCTLNKLSCLRLIYNDI